MASLGSAAARRSIQLNELVLNSGNAYIPRLTTWFQHESFLFDIMQLRSLQVRNVGHARAIPVVPLLQYVGASLKELHLQASQAYRPLEEDEYLDSDWNGCTVKQLIVELQLGHYNPLETSQWDQ
ncbi:hypothetical protein BT96DRAFT_936239 [Gymnopus androsaceus JB14]|uniref:Uncharacterized protein n=1 Tax=Gymnopus androsaceus JB14 TaxID=1447944 RepID=A0A6A4HYH2_9AGAR|nr:hypothetical protein BT96DRAFT_936239 [Gymnopus androsaceus JB14]